MADILSSSRQTDEVSNPAGPMTLDLNDPELEFSNLVDAYITWVLAVINDEKLESEDQLLTDDISEDALNAMRFLPGDVTSAIDAEELANLLFPED